MSRLLKLGALAGLVGGIALALFLRFVGEGPIGDAVALEQANDHGTAHEELFSRATQQVGGMIGAAVYGVAVGAVLVVVFALVRHRLPGLRDDWRRAVATSAAAFWTVSLVPFLKYPANPPAVGNPDTIGRRTALYVLMILWSCVATWAGFRVASWWRDRPDHVRLPAAVATTVVIVALGFVLLPGSPDAVEAPATLVWRFRVASLGGQAVFFAVTGAVLGWLLVRSPARNRPAGKVLT